MIAALDEQGRWLAPLGTTSHPFRRHGSTKAAAGDYAQTLVGDDTDTSPWRDESVAGISTAAFIRNMGTLIRALEGAR